MSVHNYNFSIIVAVSDGLGPNIIGNKGEIPWHSPLDLKYFKARTENNIVIMGRKTYESIGKPLPNRHNMVLSRDRNYRNQLPMGVEHYGDLSSALKSASTYKEKETFIIGGGQIYGEALMIGPEYIYITYVSRKDGEMIKGDTTFPNIPKGYIPIDKYETEDGDYRLKFMTYEREKT